MMIETTLFGKMDIPDYLEYALDQFRRTEENV